MLGLNGGSEHTRRTAQRMVASYRDLLSPKPFDATTFANDEGHHDLVISRSVPFASLCNDRLLLPQQRAARTGSPPSTLAAAHRR
ncbi:GTP cyclohydrolase I [Virgisporangium aurantiacum]|uniref:Uncharacterized protein n=1 Tax=Virgisporangium aurantiacum TaxID=175570 RepID=A0A8J3ZDU2_9ACTN|nr:GTP cyclohydrolase I [Virgisporangium aurantiacum]GIJ62129.1 hypothetical protein Vau01_096450 [Virgisporangium aurantiacum]